MHPYPQLMRHHSLPLVLSVLLTLLALSVPTAAQDGGGDDDGGYDGGGLTGHSEEVYDQTVTEVLEVPTDHGTIYGEVIRPVVEEGVMVPVILTYSPYNVLTQTLTGNGSIADDATADYYVPRGYARAVFDVVGTRNSGGCYDYGGIGERETGAAVVDFLGTREWSNGRVGMIGGSYDGTTQWAVAIEQPEHLTTIVPQVAIDRWYDYAFGGGIRYFLNNENPTDEGFDTPLAFDFGFGLLPSPDPARQSPELFVESLEGKFNPCSRVENTQRAYEFDPVYDEFWEERDYQRHAGDITASVLVEGGWLDHNVKHWDSTRMFASLPEDLPRHLVMGQWNHTSNQHEDAQDLKHAWFDYWLMDLPTGVETLPLVDSQTGGTEQRLADDAWPPAGTAVAELPLVTGVAVDSEAGTRPDDPAEDGAAAFEPQLTLVGTEDPTWGEQDPPTTEEEIFSSETSGRGTYLHFLGEELTEDVRIAGSPDLTLQLTTDGESTHFTPVLYEQLPDGSTSVITRGFLNVRNRNGLDVSEDLEPDAPYAVTVDLWDTDYTVAAGNRIGLAVSSGNADWALPDDDAQGTNTLEGTTASALTLPVSTGYDQVGATPPQAGPDVDRLAGEDRVSTAVAISAATFDRADNVVIATGADYPDALTAGPLARALDAPLLLTGSDRLDEAVATEVLRLQPATAVLVGGTSALSQQVEQDLADLGVQTQRAAGPDRFATAAAVAERVVETGDAAETAPFVVEGANSDPSRGWPDAVSAAPLAAFTGQPILLVTTDQIPEATATTLQDLAVTGITVVGGQAAVSAGVVDQLEEIAPVDRVEGPTRYATSAAVHARMVQAGMSPAIRWLATGRNWPDALTAGPAVAATGGTFTLIDGQDLDGSPETRDLLDDDVVRVRLLGGTAAISAEVAQTIDARLAE
ncbi:MAG: CocE/NonD family hydrolase [Euzebya sp.]